MTSIVSVPMPVLFQICVALAALALCIAAGSLLWIALALHRGSTRVVDAARRLSGGVSAARELVRRASEPLSPAMDLSASPRWADLISGRHRCP